MLQHAEPEISRAADADAGASAARAADSRASAAQAAGPGASAAAQRAIVDSSSTARDWVLTGPPMVVGRVMQFLHKHI